MKTFISEVVSAVLESKNPLMDTLCVIPSERAAVFLKEELKEQIDGLSFLPEILSIENFIEKVSELTKIDTITLLFDFYLVYQENNPNNKIDFDSFSQWGAIALQDFNEVDRHLVNAEKLFDYLKDIKRIEKWSLNSEDVNSEIMNNHLSFMEVLGDNYVWFYEYLLKNKKGYQGLLYREASKNIGKFIEENATKNIVLIGFNALNKAEEYIFQELLKSGNTTIYWDADEYYLNTNKSAGLFMRKYKQNWTYFEKNQFNYIGRHLKTKKNIHEIAASKNVAQIKAVGELLSKQNNLQNTALVLADESLLSLTLNSLPKNVDKLNITMGYLLKDMPMSGLFQVMFDLYLTQEKLKKVENNEFYYKDIERLLQNPFFYRLFGKTKEFDALRNAVVKNNQVFVSYEFIKQILSNQNAELLLKVFGIGQDVALFINTCVSLIEANKDNFEGFEKECLYRFYNLFLQLQNLNGAYEHIRTIKTLHGIYKQLIGLEKLSFQGEPLSGLQLMGMLETRVLDFETVIITSMNEGVLPAGNNENSFIPFDVKKEYGLPTYQEKDAIFSYHFYRLLQRAKNVYLLYNTETDEHGAGEKSRFLSQLEIDDMISSKKTVAPVIGSNTHKELEIQKTPEVIDRLKAIAGRGFSPSALATYVTNPLTYYKRYILGIKDLDEVEETIAFNTMGTVVHEVLELFYKPFVGKFLQVEDVKAMFSKIETTTTNCFQRHYKNGAIDQGKNKLISEVAKTFVSNFLKTELELLKAGKKLKIIGTETKIEADLKIEGLNFPIKIRGEVDRIDELDGVTRIVDYKTGKVVDTQLKISDFEKVISDYKYTKALQVMLYAYLYTKSNKHIFDGELESGIYSFKNMKSGFLKMNFAEGRAKDFNVTEERIFACVDVVKKLITELFDTNSPFIENIDSPY
ncbi:PD-(D/E)XK nuclease family protein [Flavicella sediminum]|uniref:PD-(D/E)XK nuclease family protein n=1 Tax=Flavicella sediminum TaxID=2585141 RepID=UPI001122C02F|nr:PD-(D/E)XK nuclease family protein [Flavicella sediminum]